jgi:glycosyltransferase involved in cell wall biosynthesis
LVAQGHEVTLFASGDSVSKARIIAPCDTALRLSQEKADPVAYHLVQLQMVLDMLHEFEIIHFHTDYYHYPVSNIIKEQNLTTLHGKLSTPGLDKVYQLYRHLPLVSISNSQRKPVPFANWKGTVYHGLPENLFTYREKPGEYFAFLGRISPEKRVDRAIQIALKTEIPLKIAAKIDKEDQEYYESQIKHLLNHPLIEYIGEIGEHEKNDFLGNALAMLFPIDWEEPFGLVMIEAMACGTPVIAFKRGSVPEVMDDGISGYVVETVEEAVAAVKQIPKLKRYLCRKKFEERFSVKRMAKEYVNIYENVIDEKIKYIKPVETQLKETQYIATG